METQIFLNIAQQREIIFQIEYKLHRRSNGDQQSQSEKEFLPFSLLEQNLCFKLFRSFFKRYAASWNLEGYVDFQSCWSKMKHSGSTVYEQYQFLFSFCQKHNENSEKLISIIQQGRRRDLSHLIDTWTSHLMPCFETFVQSKSFSDYKAKVNFLYYECLAQESALVQPDEDSNYPSCKCEECWQKHRDARRKAKSRQSKHQKHIATSYTPQKHLSTSHKPPKHIATSYKHQKHTTTSYNSPRFLRFYSESSGHTLREFVPESVGSIIVEFVQSIDNRIEELLAKIDINPKYLDNFIRQDISFDSIPFLTEYKVFTLVPTIGSRFKLRAYIRQQRKSQTDDIYPKGPMQLISRASDRQ